MELKIGLLRNVQLKSVEIIAQDHYFISASNSDLTKELKENSKLNIKSNHNKVQILLNDHLLGEFDTIYAHHNTKDTCVFTVVGKNPALKKRSYYGEFEIFSNKGKLTLVNNVDIEKYLIGVLESEVGLHQTIDFYKVHSIISRTYALKNQYKFIHEGYNLTDLVNCQVYKGKMYNNKNIIDAVRETRNLILVDENMDYITAAYFSNSGGQTNNVEDVWLKALPYLRSIHDPYSVHGYNYEWEKTISKKNWLDYLNTKFQFPIDNPIAVNSACNFKQEIRHKYLIDWMYRIPLTQIRKDWKLKSTYFSIFDNGNDQLILKGKGFGHGVGLSQEGAMKMIDLGYNFLDVLRFYYTDVHLIDRRMRDFYLLD
ncbi:MAG: SpoIID/LytB domain-containing protein [Bacteroidota bacterium]|nr:SpoIID/LytB domain-containing protein [Bacteroidota bacterium]